MSDKTGGLFQPFGAQRDIRLPLPTALAIPRGLAVSDQQHSSHGRLLRRSMPANQGDGRRQPIVARDKASYEWREDARETGAVEREERTIPKKVFVGNLSFHTTQDQLSAAFAPAGQVVSVHIGTDRETGRSRGFAFVEFSSDEEAQRAITSFNDFELDGRKLRVNSAEDRPPRRGPAPGGFSPPRSFNGGGGGGFQGFQEQTDSGFGGGFGKPFRKPKGSRRGLRGRKRSLGG